MYVCTYEYMYNINIEFQTGPNFFFNIIGVPRNRCNIVKNNFTRLHVECFQVFRKNTKANQWVPNKKRKSDLLNMFLTVW